MGNVDNIKSEVLIAGAGPAGLMMACRLALLNVRFRIIDMKGSPSAYSGAMIVHARTLELFEQLGLAGEMVEQGTKMKALNVVFNGKKSRRLNLEDKAGELSKFPFVLMLEQSKTERILVDYLTRKGIKVEWETRLEGFTQSESHVEAKLVGPDGSSMVAKTEYLIAADGGKSLVRSVLGIPFIGETHNMKLSVMECDADVELPPGEACFSFSKQATAGFFPLAGDRWRIDAAFQKMKGNDENLTFDKVQGIFNSKTRSDYNIRLPGWFSVFHSHGRVAEQFGASRIYLAGDAAHLFTPVGGQGMNTGLQDACNLAWKLAMVLQRKVVPEVLDTYQQERKPVAVATCLASDRFFKLAASEKPRYRLFRRFILPVAMKMFFRGLNSKKAAGYVFRKISGLGIAYSPNAVNVDYGRNFYDRTPRPGQRFPLLNTEVSEQYSGTVGNMSGSRFHLLAFGDEKNLQALKDSVGRYSDAITFIPVPFSRETSGLYLAFGIKAAGWYLVRPDLYIASRSDEPGDAALREYLKTRFITA